jgi:hypothetical protein
VEVVAAHGHILGRERRIDGIQGFGAGGWISVCERGSINAKAFFTERARASRGRAWHGERVRQAAGRTPVLRG